MGEMEGDDLFLKRDMQDTLSKLAEYFSKREKTISYGCGYSGHAAHFRGQVERHGGVIDDVLPDFFADKAQRYADLQRMKVEADFYQAADGSDYMHLQNIDAVLNFKRNFLQTGGLKCVLPGYIGTLSELTLSIEENDSAVRFGLDVPLRPIIVINLKGLSSKHYDPYIELLERPIGEGRAHANRRNLVKFVDNVDEFIKLFEAYEKLGPVMAKDVDKFVPTVEYYHSIDGNKGRRLDRFDASQDGFIPNLY